MQLTLVWKARLSSGSKLNDKKEDAYRRVFVKQYNVDNRLNSFVQAVFYG